MKFQTSDTVLNELVRRVLDEVSEHNINDSAHTFKTMKSPTACFTVRIIREKKIIFK